MTTVALVSEFEKLNDDRSLAIKPNAASREREAVVDVTFGDSEDYSTGGVTANFALRGFTTVYAVDILRVSSGFLVYYEPATGNAAASGKLKFYGYDGSSSGTAPAALDELDDDTQLTREVVVRCRIRGI